MHPKSFNVPPDCILSPNRDVIVNKLVCWYVVGKGGLYVVVMWSVCGWYVVGKGSQQVVSRELRVVNSAFHFSSLHQLIHYGNPSCSASINVLVDCQLTGLLVNMIRCYKGNGSE